MLKYIANVIVNGPAPSLGAVGGEPAILDPKVPSLDPAVDMPEKTKPSLRDIYLEVRFLFLVAAAAFGAAAAAAAFGSDGRGMCNEASR